jgi:hypothetical protein
VFVTNKPTLNPEGQGLNLKSTEKERACPGCSLCCTYIFLMDETWTIICSSEGCFDGEKERIKKSFLGWQSASNGRAPD